jgi:hypothetical protein
MHHTSPVDQHNLGLREWRAFCSAARAQHQEGVMLDIDWGSASPSYAERLVVTERLAGIPVVLGHATLSFRAEGTRFEARFSLSDGPAIRLSDTSLRGVVERISLLLTIMVDERQRYVA